MLSFKWIFAQDILFTYQTPLTSLAVNPVLPHEIAVGTSDSHVYVMDRRKLGGNSESATQSILSNMSVPGLTKRPYQITSVEFSSEGDQILASYSGEGVYLFDVKVSLFEPKKELFETITELPF